MYSIKSIFCQIISSAENSSTPHFSKQDQIQVKGFGEEKESYSASKIGILKRKMKTLFLKCKLSLELKKMHH